MELSENALIVAKSRYFMDNETSWDDVSNRIANEIGKVDNDLDFITDVHDIILNGDFLPGGRIIRNIGRLKGSLMNCNVVPINDSIEEISDAIKDSLIIWSYGGGVGINFSTLRPKGSKMNTKGGTSSGLVSFLSAIDSIAKTIESGGQRRAAGMAFCDVSHPEIMDFIDVKMKDGLLSHFNLSVVINNKFLEAVENGDSWDLTFGGVIHDTVDANDLWNKILNNMLNHAEPGLINWDNLIKNNSYYFQKILCTNPCGEQPLPAYGSCCLGSINLKNFTVGRNTCWKKLRQVIKTSVRFLDNVIDRNFYPLNQLEITSKNSRRIGLGVMGLADYLLAKKLKYGDEKACREIERLFKFFRDESYIASIELAKLKSPFAMYDKCLFNKAAFIKKLPVKIRMMIKKYGIRNSNILTSAPTGTTSLIPNVSSGIEPIFAKAYKRSDRINERIYIHEEYEKTLNDDDDYFVDSFDLKPENHLEMQRIVGQYLDSSISKTINLPKETTEADLSELLLEYIYDLKGCTVYRDGSREGAPLNRLSKEEVLVYLKNKEKIESNLDESDVKCASGKCDL